MKDHSNKNMYSQIQRFADVTRTLIMQGNIQRAKRCLLTAESIFKKGNVEIKNTIRTIYMPSISNFMEIHHCNIKNLVPVSLLDNGNKIIG